MLTTASINLSAQKGMTAVKSAEYMLNGNNDADIPAGYQDVLKALADPTLAKNPRMWAIATKCFWLIAFKSHIEAVSSNCKVSNPGFQSVYAMSQYFAATDVVKRGEWADAQGDNEYNSIATALNECTKVLGGSTPNYDSAALYYELILDVFSKSADSTKKKYENQGFTMLSMSGTYAEYLARNKDPKKKMEGLKKLVESGTNQMAAYKLYAFGFLEAGDTAKALTTLKEYSDKFPDKSDLFELLLWMYDKTNNQKQAIAELDARIQNNPDGKYYFLRGYNGFKMNADSKEAMGYYLKALELEPGNYDANWEYARLLFNESLTEYNNLSGAAQKAQKAKYVETWRKAKQHLLIATENSTYTKEDKILLLGNIKNVCVMLEETEEAKQYEDQIAALKAL